MSDKPKEKEGWYPGKFVQKRKSSVFRSKNDESKESVENNPVSSKVGISSSVEKDNNFGESTPPLAKSDSIISEKSTSSSPSKSTDGWYPGKFIGVKPHKESKQHNVAAIRNKFPTSKPPVKTVGNAIVKILGVKYMSATRPSFEVWVGSQVETFQFMALEQGGCSTEEFEGFFSLGDLTEDIVILVKEEYNVGSSSCHDDDENFVGRVVIPLTSYLTMNGRLPPKKEWMTVYPLANPKNPMEEYQEGLDELPASAMPKSKQSLGFICVQIELLLPEGPVYNQYMEGEPPRPSRRLLATHETTDGNLVDSVPIEKTAVRDSDNFDPEKFFRICKRLQNFMTTPPAAIAPVLKFPEVVVLIALYGFLCFGASAANFPIILFFVVALNGILTSKSYKVVLWNEMLDHSPNAVLTDPHTGKPLSLALKKSPEYVYQHLQHPLYESQIYLEKLVNFLEVMSNMWNFSDVRASLVFYGFFGVFTLLATVVVTIFSARMLLFIVGAVLLLLNSVREVFPELFSLDQLYQMLTSERHDEKFQSVRNIFAKFWLAYSRVPNHKTMIHRHIARTCIVADEGEEMKDASLKLKNM